jgi:hypothetical protein
VIVPTLRGIGRRRRRTRELRSDAAAMSVMAVPCGGNFIDTPPERIYDPSRVEVADDVLDSS